MRQAVLTAAQLMRRHKRVATLLLYAGITAVGYTLAFHIKFGFAVPAAYAAVLAPTLLLVVVLRTTSFAFFRLDRTTWRFAGTSDVIRLGGCTLAGTLALLMLSEAGTLRLHIPRIAIVLEAGITANLTAAVWLFYRVGYEYGRKHDQATHPKRALIAGAGEAGHLLAHEIQRFALGYELLGFIDDDPAKLHMELCGAAVLGTTAQLDEIVRRTGADELLISTRWSDQKMLLRAAEAGEHTGLRIKLLPAFSDLVKGEGLLARLRDVRLEDLLGRDPVQLELPELAADLRGRTVLVTGGAGSIGSELARQIALHEPGTLVLFDHNETQLFFAELELRERHPDLEIVALVGDVTDRSGLERVFREYGPDRVFHAAAYKHVPMMETNAREAIRNNVLGTRNAALLSGEYGAEKFVLMSTDKAVRPCSVMGATKRLAELAVLELQAAHPHTAYCGVRFGNVLGSSGSVLPIFARQLAAGRPLTVTHPDMTRYFMTIPEAVQLILQATLLPGIEGRLAILEMGEPVQIMELARNFLRLSGRGGGNGIVFTGLRAGERLHEQLTAPDEETVATAISKVRIVLTPRADSADVGRLLQRFEQMLNAGDDGGALLQLKRQFPQLRFTVPPNAGGALGDERTQRVGTGSTALVFPKRPGLS